MASKKKLRKKIAYLEDLFLQVDGERQHVESTLRDLRGSIAQLDKTIDEHPDLPERWVDMVRDIVREYEIQSIEAWTLSIRKSLRQMTAALDQPLVMQDLADGKKTGDTVRVQQAGEAA